MKGKPVIVEGSDGATCLKSEALKPAGDQLLGGALSRERSFVAV
jgi:hypothetical protein